MNLQPYTVQGYRGAITVTPTSVILTHQRRYKEIRIYEITGVLFMKAGLLNKGYIRFSFRGGAEFKPGLLNQLTDENALLFKRKQEPGILRAKELIEYYQRGIYSLPR